MDDLELLSLSLGLGLSAPDLTICFMSVPPTSPNRSLQGQVDESQARRGRVGRAGRPDVVHGSRTEGGSALSYSKQNLPLTLAPFCLSVPIFSEQLSTLTALFSHF